MKYSHQHFSDCLFSESDSTMFLQLADKEKMADIISFLKSDEASGPSSIIQYYFF